MKTSAKTSAKPATKPASAMAQTLAPVAATVTATPAKPVKTLPLYAASLTVHTAGFTVKGVAVTGASVLATGPKFASLSMGPEGSQKHAANELLATAAQAGQTYAQWQAACQAANLWAPIARPHGAGNYPVWHLLATAIKNGWVAVA